MNATSKSKARIEKLLKDPEHTGPNPAADRLTRGDDINDPKHQRTPGNPGGSKWREVAPGVYEDEEEG